jgi:hypothetical protein
METLACPLLLVQYTHKPDLAKCRKEDCAWYVIPDKGCGNPGCAILKLGEATLAQFKK